MITRFGERHRGCRATGVGWGQCAIIPREEERHRAGVVGKWGRVEVGARWLQGQESVIGVVGYYGVIKRESAAALRLQRSN